MKLALHIVLPCGTQILATPEVVTVVARDGHCSMSLNAFIELALTEKASRKS